MDDDTLITKDKTMIDEDETCDHHGYPDDREMYRREAELRANQPTYSLAETMSSLPDAEECLVKAKTYLSQVEADIMAGIVTQSEGNAAKKNHLDASKRVHGLRARIRALAKIDSPSDRSSIAVD